MGKAKPRHKTSRRLNQTQPNGLLGKSSEEVEELNPKKEELFIKNAIDEIQSVNDEEKICGLQSLADLAESESCVDNIIKFKVLKIVAPLLMDKNSEVRNLTAGLLRNLSATGSVEICDRLVKDDIMTSLIALLQQYSDWKPESNSENTDTLLQVVNILWNICETNELALKYFNSANVLSVLLRCLDYKTVGLDLSITVCQCLNSISEDNPVVLTVLRSHELELLSLLTISPQDKKLLLFKTLIAGIIVNLNPSAPWLVSVMTTIQESLSEDLRLLVKQLSSQIPLDSTDTPLSSEAKEHLGNAEALAQAQIMALEILANLTSSQDDEMDVESEESGSEEETELNGWSEMDESTLPLAVSTEIYEGLEKFKLVTAVISKLEPFPDNVMDIVSNCTVTKPLSKKIIRLQCRAFLCLNNLVSMVDLEQLGGPHQLHCLVQKIFSQRLYLPKNNDVNTELLEAVTAAARAILLRLASIKFSELLNISAHQLEVIFSVGANEDPQIQANVIRIVGTLCALLSDDFSIVKSVGGYLLNMAEKQQALWLTAEALDSILDVFSEDSTDQVAAEINLIPRLQTLLPRLKSRMRQERKTLGDHYAVVSTVMTNLSPFIKYKSARIAAIAKK